MNVVEFLGTICTSATSSREYAFELIRTSPNHGQVKGPPQSPIWELQVLPSRASRGMNGSGVELLHVYYKGRRVLAQGHVPILNVKHNRVCLWPVP